MVNIVGKDRSATNLVTHHQCGAVLEYVENDVRSLWRGTDYGGGPDGADGVTCPRCGGDIITRRW